MQTLIHWFMTHATVLAVLATVGVAILLAACLGCSKCPAHDKDNLFKRHEL